MDEAGFFEGQREARAIFEAVKAVVEHIGEAEARVSRSQIAFWRAHPFAAVWRPNQYLGGERPPIVLSIYLSSAVPSARWKEVVEPKPGRFTHHLEVAAPAEVDDEVRAWLAQAWAEAS